MFLKQCLRWASYSRIESIRKFAWTFIEPMGHVFSPSDSATRILVGGDVCFDRENRTRRYWGAYRLKEGTAKYLLLKKIRRKLWGICCRLFFSPKFFSNKVMDVPFYDLLVRNPENEKRSHEYKADSPFKIDYSSAASKFDYPFERITPFLKEKDVVMVNLETPLAGNTRTQGFFISDPRYAQAMKNAGISIVNLANNHIFDARDPGFLQTLDHLKDAGISYTGAGYNFEDARSVNLLQLNGMKFIFLNYTHHCNVGFASIAAEYSGILPLDRQLIVEDIKKAKKEADYVFVSLHWGFENQPNVHPKQKEIAHLLIDAGADGIIGHHPHVPHGIEVYKKRPILYSLGNFIFGRWNDWSNDNYLAEIIIDQKRIQGIIIYPISGKGKELFQPELLNGTRSNSVLHELQIKSEVFNTGIAIQNNVGYIKIP